MIISISRIIKSKSFYEKSFRLTSGINIYYYGLLVTYFIPIITILIFIVIALGYGDNFEGSYDFSIIYFSGESDGIINNFLNKYLSFEFVSFPLYLGFFFVLTFSFLGMLIARSAVIGYRRFSFLIPVISILIPISYVQVAAVVGDLINLFLFVAPNPFALLFDDIETISLKNSTISIINDFTWIPSILLWFGSIFSIIVLIRIYFYHWKRILNDEYRIKNLKINRFNIFRSLKRYGVAKRKNIISIIVFIGRIAVFSLYFPFRMFTKRTCWSAFGIMIIYSFYLIIFRAWDMPGENYQMIIIDAFVTIIVGILLLKYTIRTVPLVIIRFDKEIEKLKSKIIRNSKELAEKDLRDPILFLRSFKDDQILVDQLLTVPRWFAYDMTRSIRLEEVIANVAFINGPVIAINDPATKLTPLGAARDTVLGEDWHSTILSHIEEAQKIICLLSNTTGLKWEIEQIIELGALQKTVFIFPPEDSISLRNEKHEKFLESINNISTDLGELIMKEVTEMSKREVPLLFFFSESKNQFVLVTSDSLNELTYEHAVSIPLSDN